MTTRTTTRFVTHSVLTCDDDRRSRRKLSARTGAASQHPAPPSMSLRRVTRLALALARASSHDGTAPLAPTMRVSTSTHLAAWSARASRHGLAAARCAFVSAGRPAPGDSPGLRAKHLRHLDSIGYDRATPVAVTEWDLALTAHSLLLRGGEVGARWQTRREQPATPDDDADGDAVDDGGSFARVALRG